MMPSLFKSDLFRNFLFGFAAGAVALVAFQPYESRAELTQTVYGAINDISGELR